MKTDTNLSRRRLLASVPAVAAAGVPSVATALGGLAMGSDPIFAAIEREWQTREVYLAVKAKEPGYFSREAELVSEAAYTPWIDALHSFLGTTPTTSRGIGAFMDNFAAVDAAVPGYFDGEDMAEAFQALAPAIRAVLTA